MPRIVFLYKFPMNVAYAEIIDFESYFRQGFEVLLLDLSQLFYPDDAAKYASSNSNYLLQANWIVACKTRAEVIDYIRVESPRALFYILDQAEARNTSEAWLFRAFKRYCSRYVLQGIGQPPILSVKGQVIAANWLHHKTWLKVRKKLTNSLFRALIRRNIIYRRPSLCLPAGAVSRRRFEQEFPGVELADVPNMNMSRFVKWAREPHTLTENIQRETDFILYLDQSIFCSPDALLFNKKTIDPEVFFLKIRQLFDRIERVVGKRIVIAASPKYQYKGDEYGTRTIVRGDTITLTKACVGAIVHMTSAVEFAVAFHKPILFITFDEFSNYIKEITSLYAGSLNREYVSAERVTDEQLREQLTNINEAAYDNYVRNYLNVQPFNRTISEIAGNLISAMK
jgi:hypothetical protein